MRMLVLHMCAFVAYRDLRAKLELAVTHTLDLAQHYELASVDMDHDSENEEYTNDAEDVSCGPCVCVVGLLVVALMVVRCVGSEMFCSKYLIIWVSNYRSHIFS